MRRRTWLGLGLSAAAVSAISCNRSGASSSWTALTDSEARTLEAACAQLIPADQDPGAKEAGVVVYIDTQLSRSFRRHRKAYRQGLAGIDTASVARFGKSFPDLTGTQQVEILNSVEEKDRQFFDLLLSHARQGFYGDPRHGGNRNMASWKMVGLSFPPVRGREHYQG